MFYVSAIIEAHLRTFVNDCWPIKRVWIETASAKERFLLAFRPLKSHTSNSKPRTRKLFMGAHSHNNTSVCSVLSAKHNLALHKSWEPENM